MNKKEWDVSSVFQIVVLRRASESKSSGGLKTRSGPAPAPRVSAGGLEQAFLAEFAFPARSRRCGCSRSGDHARGNAAPGVKRPPEGTASSRGSSRGELRALRPAVTNQRLPQGGRARVLGSERPRAPGVRGRTQGPIGVQPLTPPPTLNRGPRRLP